MGRLLSPHFSEDELWCKGQDYGTCNCNHSCYIDPKVIELLEKLRYNIGGYPLTINSGYRCRVHNKSDLVGGASDSQHCRGTAVDIACPSQLDLDVFKWYVLQLEWDAVGVYYPSAGYSPFIHCDIRDGASTPPGTPWEERWHWEYR